MKIVVVGGTGAMGGVWASALHRSGHDVHILGVSPGTIDAINRNGLTVEEPDGSRFTSHIPATDDASKIGSCDLAILFTKAHHTASAAVLMRPAVGPETIGLSLQNGWGNLDVLAETYPVQQLAMGITYHGARVISPGVIAHTSSPGVTTIGPFAETTPFERVEEISLAMNEAGIRTAATMDIKTEVWKKLVLNAAGLPVAALTELTAFGMSQRPDLVDVCNEIAREGVAVGIAMGFSIDVKERVAMVQTILSGGGTGRASMLQDVEARRKTEIDVINGAIVREGIVQNVPTPLNALMTTLIRAREASWVPS